MSRFITKIPVPIETTVALLPKKSDIEEVRLSEDGKSVEIAWSNDWRRTAFTVPIDWSLNTLKARQMPRGVIRIDGEPTTGEPQLPAPAAKPAELCLNRFGAYTCRLIKGHTEKCRTERGIENGEPSTGTPAPVAKPEAEAYVLENKMPTHSAEPDTAQSTLDKPEFVQDKVVQ